MPEYCTVVGVVEVRRAHALAEAMRSDDTGLSDGELLARAKAFEDYLSGKTFTLKIDHTPPVPLPVQIQPPPEPEPEEEADEEPSLPEPSHALLDGDGKCLGCAWMTLKRKIA